MEPYALNLLLIAPEPAGTAALRQALAHTLPAGSSQRLAASLREGLSLLTAGGIDAVILDPELPDSQGPDTLEAIRHQAARLAVIVLTGRDDEGLVQKALECGVQEYLLWSEVNARALVRTLRLAVERKRRESVRERTDADEARLDPEAHFRTLIDAVPQVIWTNETGGEANYFNRRWFEYSGLSLEQSTGPGWQAIVHPDDAPASGERWRQALAAGKVFDAEYRLRRADGVYRWHLGRNVPLRDEDDRVLGWFGSATDIHDLKEAQTAATSAQERIRLIVENARDYVIFSLDLDRRIVSWNAGASGILGYTHEEAIGQSGDVIFTSEDRAAGAPEQEAATALAEGRAADERWHVRRDKTRFWGSGVMMAMRDPQGRAVGLLKIFRDQTRELEAKKALEQSRAELGAALRETERARREAEAASEAKDHFLAVLSHELRTPLTPILIALDSLARRTDLPAPVQRAHAMIERNVRLEAHFIDDLLDVTRISRGKMEIVRADMDLHEAVARAVEISSPDIEEKHQVLTVALDAPEHRVHGDFARLQQAFWNLLKNASKFTPQGGRVGLRSRNEPGRIVLEVADSGIGMDAEVIEKIFHPFEQADPQITREFGGLGLGLAIAKATVDAHEGTLTASSPGRDQGATFTLSLPLVSSPVAPHASPGTGAREER